ncbi:MAG TPA: MauE/DoxX family redox-associated membrane protein [Ktedonobacteraceae bacterium]|nr:MauE/DoxX family redox-associated membrane protein [Ktedonobacteraceae bacterium]
MPLSATFVSVRLFVRLLLGVLLLSVSMSKFAHPRQFQQGIQDYQVVPAALQSKSGFLMALSAGIPVAELLAGLGLLSGFWLVPAALLAVALFVVFCIAITINLKRGRRDLSCHCGGALGNHLISWWLVGRNGILLVGLLVLLVTPSDTFTVASFVRSPSLLNASLVSTIVPVAVLVGAVIVVIVLFNAAQVLWRS